MSSGKRLIWLCPEFTPYHEVLFRALAADAEISLRVEVMSGPTQTHPFELGANRPYEWGQANPQVRVDDKLIARTLKETQTWVVVASYLKPTLMAAMRALARENRRFIYFTDTPLPQTLEWNTDRPRRRSWLRRLARSHRLHWIFHQAHRVLATGQPGVDAVVSMGCPKEKAVVFPFWVDLSSRKKAPSPADESHLLLSVGQLVYRKGCDIAIQAFGRALQTGKISRVRLHFVGDGPERRHLERLAEERGLSDQVVFHSWLQPPAVLEKLQQADALIHTARWDPFPVVVLEAMANGLPVLGSDKSGSVIDRVEDGVSGFIHRTGDSEQLAQQIADIFSDRDRLSGMGAAARSKAEEWPPERGVEIIKNIIFND